MSPNSCAILGKFLSPRQKSKIIKSPVEEVIIGLDPDAYLQALQIGLELCNYKKVKILNWKGDKDINDLGKVFTKGIEKETSFMNYTQILMAKKEYENR